MKKRKVKYLKDWMLSIQARAKTIHQILLCVQEEKVLLDTSEGSRNAYQMLLDWSLDYIIVIGISATIVACTVFRQGYGWKTFIMPMGFGCLVYVLELIIKKTRRAYKDG